MSSYYIGLDIGGTKCAVNLARVRGGVELLDRLSFPTPPTFSESYERLCGDIERMLSSHGLTHEAIRAIGVSCGGPLDAKRGVVLCPPNLPDWKDIPLTRMLSERFHAPAYLQNDANACALAEWKAGAGRGCDSMVFLTMGTGMGGGLILDRRLLDGACGMGGEIGHLRLAEDGPVGFGKAGSFEGFCSGGGIERQAVAYTRELTESGFTPAWAGEKRIDARVMAEYARRGDARALVFFDRVGAMLGRGLSLLIDTLNPQRIVIGSVFVRCEELLRPAMEREMRKECIPQSLQSVRVVPAALGERLGDYASVMAALYAMGVDPTDGEGELPPAVAAHYERLFARYPVLEPCRDSVMTAYRMLERCYRGGHKLLLCGNGGSCADCGHIAGELMKGFYLKRPLPEARRRAIADKFGEAHANLAGLLQGGLPAIALTEHSALNTAIGNDLDQRLCYAQQLLALGREGDVLLGISTSGNAENVAFAVGTAKALGVGVIGLTGGAGGRLKDCADCCVAVPATVTADVQELHLPVYHTLCAMLEAAFFGGEA